MKEQFPAYYQRDKDISPEKKEKVGRLRSFLEWIESRLQNRCDVHEIHAQILQFSISNELRKRQGPMIEVGGPTDEGFRLVPTEAMREIHDRFYISNQEDGLYAWRQRFLGDKEGERYKEWPVDFTADATALPFPDGFLSAVFASCLPRVFIEDREATDRPLREPAIREAWRVLEPGGLLVWQGSFWNDLKTAQSLGFEMVAHAWGLLNENQLNELIDKSGADENKLRDAEWVHINLFEIKRSDPKNRETSPAELTNMTAPRYIIWRKPVK